MVSSVDAFACPGEAHESVDEQAKLTTAHREAITRSLEHAGRAEVGQALREGYRCQPPPVRPRPHGGTLAPAGG